MAYVVTAVGFLSLSGPSFLPSLLPSLYKRYVLVSHVFLTWKNDLTGIGQINHESMAFKNIYFLFNNTPEHTHTYTILETPLPYPLWFPDLI